MKAQSWEGFRALKGKVIVERKENALITASEWQGLSCTVWADGPRLESRAVGAAVAFWDGGGWVKRVTYLGRNKEIFDAEVFVILRAVRLFNGRSERGQEYTIFSDSQAAVTRVQHDRCGPAQALAKATISMTKDLCARDNILTIRWTPAHEGFEGNEQADEAAKSAAEGTRGRAEPEYLQGASFSHLMRKTTEMRTQAMSELIRGHVGRRHRNRPPPGGRMRKGLARARKELAGQFTSLCQDTRQQPTILCEPARPIASAAGGAEAGKDRHATTFSSGADGGSPRSDECGSGSSAIVSGVAQEPRRLEPCSEMRERSQPC